MSINIYVSYRNFKNSNSKMRKCHFMEATKNAEINLFCYVPVTFQRPFSPDHAEF